MTCVAAHGGSYQAGLRILQTGVITPLQTHPTLSLHAKTRSGSRLLGLINITSGPRLSSQNPRYVPRIEAAFDCRQLISQISPAFCVGSKIHSQCQSNPVSGPQSTRVSARSQGSQSGRLRLQSGQRVAPYSLPNAGVNKPPAGRAPSHQANASRVVEPSDTKTPVPDAVDSHPGYGTNLQTPPPLISDAVGPEFVQSRKTKLFQTPDPSLKPDSLEPSGDGTRKPSPKLSPKPSGSLLGAVALITGTSVGAGILALPGISAPAGFIPATSIMVGCWGFLVGEALLLAEVNVELLKRVAGDENRASDVLSLRTMAQKTLGGTGGTAATLAYVFLTYALLTAYIAKSADVLSLLLGLPTEWAGVAFVGFVGAILLVGGTVFTDYVNQAATAIMLTLFAIMVGGGSLFADWSILENADWAAAPTAIPIIFLSLVYHDLTPVLCSYLGGDTRRIRQAIILGSLVPLAMFVSCNAVALALSPITGGGDPLNIIIRLGGPGPAALIESFSLLAICTSFIGTILGATEFALEQLGGLQSARNGPPLSDNLPTVVRNEIKDKSGLRVGLGTALEVSSSKVALRNGRVVEAGDPSVQEEIDRLQNRVKAKLAQWDARFERGLTESRGGNGHMYSVNKLSKGPALGAHPSERDIYTGSVSPVDRLTVPSSLAVVNTLGLAPSDGQSGQGNGLSAEGLLKPGLHAAAEPERKLKPELTAPGSAGIPSGRESDVTVEGLWSREAPRTGRVNWALRTGAFCAVLIPPVGIASQYPDAFFQASNLAGAYGMTTLYGIFPVAMAWSMRSSVKRKAGEPTGSGDYVRLVPGGRFTLVSMGFGAVAIMVGQAALDSQTAAGAATEALREVGPALEALQGAAAAAAAALSVARDHVHSYVEASDALQSVEHSFIELAAGVMRSYAELSRVIDGLNVDEAVRSGLVSAAEGRAVLEAEFTQRLESLEHSLTGLAAGRYAELSRALEGLKLDEIVRSGVVSASESREGLEADLMERLADLVRGLESLHLAEKSDAARDALQEVVQSGLISVSEGRAGLEAESMQRLADLMRGLEGVQLAERSEAARDGLQDFSQTGRERLYELIREAQRSLQ